jgi:hypothetical protein
MKNDPIVENVRAARREVEEDAAKAGLTLGAFLRTNRKSNAKRLVRRSPVYLQKRISA